MSSTEPSIKAICGGLGRYYASLGRSYDGIFSTYCYDNGLEDDALDTELEEDPSQCLLADFDDDFPFDGDTKKKAKFIVDLIKRIIARPDITFDAGVKIPDFNANLFKVNDNDLNKVKEIYQTQCPVLWNSGMENDGTFLQILTVGYKNNFDYLGNLVDDYHRDRVKHIKDPWSEEQWAHPQNHKHFARLKNVTIRVPKKDNKEVTTYKGLATAAVKSFGARCVPKLLLSPFIQINDSIEVTIKYISDAVEFVGNLSESKTTSLPFQVDFCIGFGAPSNQQTLEGMGDVEEDDDDDDDDDDGVAVDAADGDFFDVIGNIQDKLNKNKLRHEFKQYDEGQERRFFIDMFKEFKAENNLDDEQKQSFGYPHNKRFIAFIDRRPDRPKPKGKEEKEEELKDYDENRDDIWMYEPPLNCRDIPNDVVPEWFISSSRTCLLPNIDYGDGKAAEEVEKKQNVKIEDKGDKDKKEEKDEKKDDKNATKEKLQKANIGCSSHCKGSLLTLSFIAKEIGAIKCYLYFNGQIIRFMPEDVTTTLAKLFNMKWNDGENEIYIEKKQNEIKEMVQRMRTVLKDKHFKGFQESYL